MKQRKNGNSFSNEENESQKGKPHKALHVFSYNNATFSLLNSDEIRELASLRKTKITKQ